MEPHQLQRRAAALAHLAAPQVASRWLSGAIINDAGNIPAVGDRVVLVKLDTETETGADITFDSGKTVFLHANLPYTGPQDSDTAAWQEVALAELGGRVAARHLERVGGRSHR